MKKITYLIILICYSLVGCNDLLTQEPETVVSNLNFWKNEQDVEAATSGLHQLFRTTFGSITMVYRDRGLRMDYQHPQMWGAVSKNDFTNIWAFNNPNLQWGTEYKVIAQANLIIDNIHRANLPEDRYNFHIAQALGVRAYVYFYLVKTWGDVPLVLTSEDIAEKTRMSGEKVMEQIITDLSTAEKIAPSFNNLCDAEGNPITSKQYLCKENIEAILAEVYTWYAAIYNKPTYYAEALKMTQAVINSNTYRLLNNIKELCEVGMAGNSDEGIFEADFRDMPDEYRVTGAILAGAVQKWPIEGLSTPNTKRTLLRINFSSVYTLYPDESDERRQEYFYKLDSTKALPTSTTQGAAYVRKWRNKINYTDGTMKGRTKGYACNEIFIRFANTLLLHAELCARTGDNSQAIEYLNLVKRRAKAKDYDGSPDILMAILEERDRELWLESGIRYYDYMRFGTYNQLPGKFTTLTPEDVAKGALYLPVGMPAFTNTMIKQTEYWQPYY